MNSFRYRNARLVFALTIAFGTLAPTLPASAKDVRTAVVAGGCFWCVESDFESVPGVIEVESGYTGGHTDAPTYKQVTAGGSGHYEAVRITYDADQVSYDRLMHLFFRSIDPTDAGGQFCDRGSSYRTAVFVDGADQRTRAEAALAAARSELGQPIVTPILDATPFHLAEDYHQDYYKKNPIRYNYYRHGCGRDARLEQIWGKK